MCSRHWRGCIQRSAFRVKIQGLPTLPNLLVPSACLELAVSLICPQASCMEAHACMGLEVHANAGLKSSEEMCRCQLLPFGW